MPRTATSVDPGSHGKCRLHPFIRYALALALLSNLRCVFLPTRGDNRDDVGAALSRNTAVCESMASPCLDASNAPLLPTTAHVFQLYRPMTSTPKASVHSLTLRSAFFMLRRIFGARHPFDDDDDDEEEMEMEEEEEEEEE